MSKNIVMIWLRGLASSRSGRLALAALGVAATVALFMALGIFVSTSAETMTLRAIQGVPVDWQLQLAPGADKAMIRKATLSVASAENLEEVGYADVAGLTASAGGTTQTTGVGKVIGLPPTYFRSFPAEFRLLVGSLNGVLIAQQTAANLHVSVGDTVTIQRVGLPPVDVKVAGVVDLPYADSFFQAVGVLSNAAPQAPPDNVLFLPSGAWHRLFDPQSTGRPDTVRVQFHMRLPPGLPSDPQAAFILVQQKQRNLEARMAGSGVIGDNLSAQLDSVRSDALYARVLFLFLGLPGALLAIILTLAIAATGTARRQQEQSLLRVRGAQTFQLLRLAALEGLAFGMSGVIVGFVLAWISIHWIMSLSNLSPSTLIVWATISCIGGLLLALIATLWPAWREMHLSHVLAARQVIGRGGPLLWQQLYLDLVLLAIALFMFWRTAGIGYELILAPEGVAQVSVTYEAFIAPISLWLGGVLLATRLSNLCLERGREWLAKIMRPIARNLSNTVFLSLSRQRRRVALGIALVSLAVAFALSTAIFNTTYDAQAQVDAELTNGADVSVRGTSLAPAGGELAKLRALSGVIDAEPLQHRFAYVGSDLQDLYGIDPSHIGNATHLADAYFANHDAAKTLALLASHPDGVLVSEETKNDFQLTPGDHLKLRMLSASDHQYHVVPFTFLGVVREFPTAPKDSFLVANSNYIAHQTGLQAAEYVLVKTSGDPQTVATQAAQITSALPGVQVTDIGSVQKTIGSNLTAINLHGLTALELIFAVILVASASGLILALGLVERSKTFATLLVLGANTEQLGAFVWAEGLTILTGGLLFGSVTGLGLAKLLVLMLTHVFDPPPESIVIPWAYVAMLFIAATGATTLATTGAIAAAKHAGVSILRTV
jgi:putative ABC transport system permease protein